VKSDDSRPDSSDESVEESETAEEEPSMSFSDLIAPDRWRSFKDHLVNVGDELDADLARLGEEESRLQSVLRPKLETEFGVRTVAESDLIAAKEKLYASSVSAVDGTNSIFPMRGGLRVRIGVAAITYANSRTEHVFYVSEQQVRAPEANPFQLLMERKADGATLSSMVVRCLMAYKERQIALERPEAWKLINGSVFPQELRTGLGRLRALEPCLDLAERVLKSESFVGVIGSSSHNDLLTLASALRPLEYARLWTLKTDLDAWLATAHFNPTDHARFKQFIDANGDRAAVGIYRAGSRAYVFQAPTDRFDEAAAIVMADSLHQPIRAYPLLIDYADAVCTRMLAARDFQRQVAYRLARSGSLVTEMDERSLRRR